MNLPLFGSILILYEKSNSTVLKKESSYRMGVRK